jgi:hypothetical protein
VPNGTVDCVTVTLLAQIFSQPEYRESRKLLFVYKASVEFWNCGTVIALEKGADNQLLIFYGKSIRH